MIRELETMDLNALLALHWLLEEQSVTRAAVRLHVTQPAMSRTLARLKAQLGDALFTQSGRRLVPTARAQALRGPLAESIASLRQVVRDPAPFEPSAASAPFRIACTDYLGSVASQAWIEEVRPRAPSAPLEIHALAPDTAGGLVAGKLDLVFLPDAAIPRASRDADTAQFVQRAVAQDRFVCVLRRDHPAAKRTLSEALFTTLEHVLVSPTGQGPGMVDAALTARGRSRRIAFRTFSFLHALRIVETTDAIATVPALLARGVGGLVVKRPPLPLPELAIVCAWHPSRTTDDAHRWLRERLMHAIAARARR